MASDRYSNTSGESTDESDSSLPVAIIIKNIDPVVKHAWLLQAIALADLSVPYALHYSFIGGLFQECAYAHYDDLNTALAVIQYINQIDRIVLSGHAYGQEFERVLRSELSLTPLPEEGRHRILVLALATPDLGGGFYSTLYDRLYAVARVERYVEARGALRYLTDNNNIDTILVTDVGLMKPENRDILLAVVSHVYRGCKVIFGLQFSQWTFGNFFRVHFNLTWHDGSYHLANNIYLGIPRRIRDRNSSHYCLFTEQLQSSAPWTTDAVHFIKNACLGEKIFVPLPEDPLIDRDQYDEKTEAAVLLANVGNGEVAYVGLCDEQELSVQIILALCNLLGNVGSFHCSRCDPRDLHRCTHITQ